MKTSDTHIFTLATRDAVAFAILEFLCALYGILSLVRKDSLENAVSTAIIWSLRFGFCVTRAISATLSNNYLSTPTMEDYPLLTFT